MCARLLCLVSVLLIVGCSPAPVKPPITEHEPIPQIEQIDTKALPVPAKPPVVAVEHNGQTYAGYTSEGLDQLKKAYAVARANTKALQEIIDAHNSLVRERNAIAKMVMLEQERADRLAKMWAEAESQRRYEQWANRNRLMFYETIMLLMAIGLVL